MINKKKSIAAAAAALASVGVLTLTGCSQGVAGDPVFPTPQFMSNSGNSSDTVVTDQKTTVVTVEEDAPAENADKAEKNENKATNAPKKSKREKEFEEESNTLTYETIGAESAMSLVCPYCGTANTEHSDTCKQCGSKLA